MSYLTLDGRLCAKHYLMETRRMARILNRQPGIAVIRVGDDPASKVYVSKKTARAQRLGFVHKSIELSGDVSQIEVLKHVSFFL